MTVAVPALAQQKTGPGITGDDSLTWYGITLYGVVDIGVQYDSHGAQFSDYRPGASANIVQKDSTQSVTGLTSSNMGQNRIGLQGIEPLYGDWSAVFQVETFFNPQSGEIANSLQSLVVNNGRTAATQTTNTDGSSAGQIFQTAYAGFKSKEFGTITFGRQLTLMTEGTIKYDPNYDATAFGLIGASGTYSGAGTTEDKRLDRMLKYTVSFNDAVHLGALYKFNESSGSASTAFQADIGGAVGGFSADVVYSKINDAISASALSAAQVTALAPLGYSVTNSLAATVSDNTAWALMASYKFDPWKFFAGYEHISFADPTNTISAGYTDIGGYNLAFVTTNAFENDKIVQMYWAGARYSATPKLDLTVAYYAYDQNAYGTGKSAGCSTSASSTCSGSFEAYSFDLDYHFNRHFDAYLGAMYSAVRDGVASGYAYNTTNINPTVGVRYKF
jgi:predicted porin